MSVKKGGVRYTFVVWVEGGTDPGLLMHRVTGTRYVTTVEPDVISFYNLSLLPQRRHVDRYQYQGEFVGRPRLSINMDTCVEDGCDSVPHCRGFCRRHYRRIHYREHERARRGCKSTPRIPIGGTRVNPRTGYVSVKLAPRRWVLQHRLVMEGVLGRKLHPEETVHHINGAKHDNRPSNLELWTTRHPKGQRVADLVAFAREIIDLYEGASCV